MSLSTAGPAPEPAPGPGAGPGLLSPVADEDSAPFWQYAARGELRMQSCARQGCGALRFPPRPCCPRCRSFDSEWRRMSGRGRIWSYVVPHPPLLPAYAALAPYNVVLVELAEDPRIRLAGSLVRAAGDPLGTVDPSRIRIGARVRAVFPGATGATEATDVKAAMGPNRPSDKGSSLPREGAAVSDDAAGAAGPVDPRLMPRWIMERP